MNARAFRVAIAAVSLGIAVAGPVQGATRGRAGEEITIGTCINRVAGGRAWLEKTLWGLRDQEAGWIGAEVTNPNGTHDLGPMQVNSWWIARLAKLLGRPPVKIRAWLTADACFNVDVARWIFLSELTATGDYWKAIGAYHSPVAWRQRRYALSVAGRLRNRYGSKTFAR